MGSPPSRPGGPGPVPAPRIPYNDSLRHLTFRSHLGLSHLAPSPDAGGHMAGPYPDFPLTTTELLARAIEAAHRTAEAAVMCERACDLCRATVKRCRQEH